MHACHGFCCHVSFGDCTGQGAAPIKKQQDNMLAQLVEEDGRAKGRGRGRGGGKAKGAPVRECEGGKSRCRGRGRGRGRGSKVSQKEEKLENPEDIEVAEDSKDPPKSKRAKKEAGTPDPAKPKATAKKRARQQPVKKTCGETDTTEERPKAKSKPRASKKAATDDLEGSEATKEHPQPEDKPDTTQATEEHPQPEAKAKQREGGRTNERKARYSSKSSAYHKKKVEMLAQGFDKEAALEAARKVGF